MIQAEPGLTPAERRLLSTSAFAATCVGGRPTFTRRIAPAVDDGHAAALPQAARNLRYRYSIHRARRR